jgi:hypothetical protein
MTAAMARAVRVDRRGRAVAADDLLALEEQLSRSTIRSCIRHVTE